ncbi:MAG: aspartate aminotransferase family protein [Gammaproteobacteria bacterium]|nr:aspartate aminotransferase family protein [Gammaproteobacteria bacterium]
MNPDKKHLQLLQRALTDLEQGFGRLPDFTSATEYDVVAGVLETVAHRMRDNYPYHHPLYVGQMLKPPHPVAHLAYTLAMSINPNNHALDGGRASSRMEKEAVEEIAKMFGWSESLGHLCGGGTMANLEALWIAREINTDANRPVVLASSQCHYTHSRVAALLAMPFRAVAADASGAMDIQALEQELQQGDVGTVVATLGTTLCGAIDPLPQILKLRDQYGFRLHVDTAYGGYFTLVDNLDPHARMAFDAIREADSVVIDPHKHGLQPYGCGCIIFKDPGVGRVYRHESPYTYFSSDEFHLGEISLECSRPGAAAVALWATMQMLPPHRHSEFAQQLQQCRQTAMQFYQWLHNSADFTPLFGPQLDIVLWAATAQSASATSRRSRQLFEIAAALDLHLAVATVPRAMCVSLQGIQDWDQDHVECLRACVMKPEHHEWLPEITARLQQSLAQLENQA